VQRWNDERQISEPLSDLDGPSYQHEFCTERGLDDGKAQVIIRDTLRPENRSFEEDHGRKANVKIDRKDGELDQFFVDFLAERGFGFSPAFRAVSECRDRAIMKHRGAVIGRAYPRVITSTIPPRIWGGWTRADFRNRSFSTKLGYSGDVRFPPNSDQTADVADGPVGAIKTGCGRD
jgi:hypothetical protein